MRYENFYSKTIIKTTTMKMKANLRGLLLLLVGSMAGVAINAQSKADIFDETKTIVWLGLDFTQAKFIGPANQFKDAGEITNEQFRDKYAPAWNELFVNEPKKFKVASAVHRTDVDYAIDITEKANSGIKNRDFFTNEGDQYKKLDEGKIDGLVKKYDFKGKKGIGLLFFIDGMSKAKEQAGGWVTFVDMASKKVLLTSYLTGKAGGFGFRNYWAKAFNEILKEVDDNYKSWKKG